MQVYYYCCKDSDVNDLMRKCQSYCFAETVHIRAINSISVSETGCPGSPSPDNRTSEMLKMLCQIFIRIQGRVFPPFVSQFNNKYTQEIILQNTVSKSCQRLTNTQLCTLLKFVLFSSTFVRLRKLDTLILSVKRNIESDKKKLRWKIRIMQVLCITTLQVSYPYCKYLCRISTLHREKSNSRD